MKTYKKPILEVVNLIPAEIMFTVSGEGSDTEIDGGGLWG